MTYTAFAHGFGETEE